MSSFRDKKRQMRRDVQRELSVPALYIETPGADPLPVNVRLHTKFQALGDQIGTNFHSAEREDVTPRILFMRAEVPFPKRNSIISVEVGEAYRVDVARPPDDISVTANVVQLTVAETVGLPVPEGA